MQITLFCSCIVWLLRGSWFRVSNHVLVDNEIRFDVNNVFSSVSFEFCWFLSGSSTVMA